MTKPVPWGILSLRGESTQVAHDSQVLAHVSLTPSRVQRELLFTTQGSQLRLTTSPSKLVSFIRRVESSHETLGAALVTVTLGIVLDATVGCVVGLLGASEGDGEGLIDQVGLPVGSILGILLGSSLGSLLGSSLGCSLGILLGSSLGSILGSLLGCSLGSLLGSILGCSLGSLLGCSLGSILGILLGSSLGSLLGSILGSSLGYKLGSSVGVTDGIEEGLLVGNGEGMGDGGLEGASEGISLAAVGVALAVTEGEPLEAAVGALDKVAAAVGAPVTVMVGAAVGAKVEKQ
jgi:hypothetical protein